MALKRKLSDQIARMAAGIPEQPDLVHIHVPPADAADDIIRGSEMFVNTVSKLVEERDRFKTANEQLNRKCIVQAKTIERIMAELNLCRRQTHEYVRANGEVAATIGAMLALAERASHTALMVQNISDELPAEPEPAPEPRSVYDMNGMPMDVPPQVTLEDLTSLTTVLARVEGVE